MHAHVPYATKRLGTRNKPNTLIRRKAAIVSYAHMTLQDRAGRLTIRNPEMSLLAASNLKSSIHIENSQDESIIHGDSGWVSTPAILLFLGVDALPMSKTNASGNTKENSNLVLTKYLKLHKPDVNICSTPIYACIFIEIYLEPCFLNTQPAQVWRSNIY